MPTGIVKMYDEERGFGFIKSEDHSADLFVHAKSFVGMSALIPGQVVEFSAVFDEKRAKYRAEDVRII